MSTDRPATTDQQHKVHGATEPHFEGHQPRECGEHRTTGSRAWCFDCSEWCYPRSPCVRCGLPAYRELLASIWLYVDWRYVTRQLTTEQKELWADAIETTGDPDDRTTVDRWWREPAELAAARASEAPGDVYGPTPDHHIDHEIIAEWICCDPVNPSHHLCWWGEGVRQTMRSLLADDDDEYPSKAIDGITADLQPSLPPASPTAGSNDLRQQLADALNNATWGDPISYAAHRDHGFYGKCGICTDDLPAIADVCAAEVQPVLDAKDAEIKRLNEEIDGFCEDLNDALNHNDETCEAVKDRDRWQQRAEDAERELAALRTRQQIGDLP